MGFRPDFTNPFGALGQGIREAGRSVGQFFANRAQQQYQEGVDAISQARAKLTEIAEIEENPDVQLSPEQQGALNAIRAEYGQIARAEPTQARELFRGIDSRLGVDVKTIKRATAPRPETAGTRQGGAGRQGFGQGGQAPTQDVKQVTRQDTGAFLGGLRRGAARTARERAETREDTVAARDARLQRALQDNGLEGQITLAELQQAHEMEMVGNRRDAEEYLADLAHDRGLEADAFNNMLEVARDERLFDQQLSREQIIREENRLSSALAAYSENPGNPVSLSILQNMADDPQLPAHIRGPAQAAVQADTGVAQEAYVANLRADLEEARARGDMAPLRVEQLEQEIELAERDLVIAGQQIMLNRTNIRGADLANARADFELKEDRWIASTNRTNSAAEYVSEAVNLGMPSRIAALMAARTNPDDPLHGLAQELTNGEMNEALSLAADSKNIAGRERDLADAQIDQAIVQTSRQGAVDTATLVETVAASYTPEEIETNAQLQELLDEGAISQADMDAMTSRSRLYRQIEQDEVNGPKVQAYTQRLDEYARPENFPTTEEGFATAEAGLRSTLNELASLGYMQPNEVDGLVELYRAGWQNRGEAFEMDLAVNQARLDLARSDAMLNEAQANAPEGNQLDPSYVNMRRQVVNSLIDAQQEQARLDGCYDAEGRISDDGSCAAHNVAIRGYQSDLNALNRYLSGHSVDLQNPEVLPANPEERQRLFFQNAVELWNRRRDRGDLGPEEENALLSYIDLVGGVEEFERMMTGGEGPSATGRGVSRSREEAATAESRSTGPTITGTADAVQSFFSAPDRFMNWVTGQSAQDRSRLLEQNDKTQADLQSDTARLSTLSNRASSPDPAISQNARTNMRGLMNQYGLPVPDGASASQMIDLFERMYNVEIQ